MLAGLSLQVASTLIRLAPTETPNGFQTLGFSANLDFVPTEAVMLRTEARWLGSRDRIFESASGKSKNNVFVRISLALRYDRDTSPFEAKGKTNWYSPNFSTFQTRKSSLIPRWSPHWPHRNEKYQYVEEYIGDVSRSGRSCAVQNKPAENACQDRFSHFFGRFVVHPGR
jgi:hypothetical protein